MQQQQPYQVRRTPPIGGPRRASSSSRTAVRRTGEKQSSRRERRRLLRLTVSGILLTLVVAIKLLMPDINELYREKLLQIIGKNSNFTAAFSAVGKAFSEDGLLGESLKNAYTAVFGPQNTEQAQQEPQPSPTAARLDPIIYDAGNIPENVELFQKILKIDYLNPIEAENISGFGYRDHPIDGENRFHYGVDLAADEGAPIRAFAAGTVGVVAESSELGNYLTVNHVGGFSTLYAHCSKILTSSGQPVAAGDLLAEVGQTGMATGPHLHFELHCGKIYLNPTYYVQG